MRCPTRQPIERADAEMCLVPETRVLAEQVQRDPPKRPDEPERIGGALAAATPTHVDEHGLTLDPSEHFDQLVVVK
jgi:hypothetical protein